MVANRMTLSDMIRQEIWAARSRGWTMNEIADAAGMHRTVLSKFLHGAHADMKVTQADAVMRAIGRKLEIVGGMHR